MKEKYTIGEVAVLLNVSPQTLRFYDKSGVVVPYCTDPKTGYRYYSYDQICYISRVKYLQQFGFSLEEIRDALAANNTHSFRRFLQHKRESLQTELQRITHLLEDLDWYVDYYSYLDSHDYNGLPYRQQEPERYLLAEPIRPGEDIYGTAGKRLTQMQHSDQFSGAHFLRCHGYLLDFHALLDGRILPTHYFVYLRRQPAMQHPNLITIQLGPIFVCRPGFWPSHLTDRPCVRISEMYSQYRWFLPMSMKIILPVSGTVSMRFRFRQAPDSDNPGA